MTKALHSARDYTIHNSMDFVENEQFLDAALPIVCDLLEEEATKSPVLKFNLVLEASYIHPDSSKKSCNFKTKNQTIVGGRVQTTVNTEEESEDDDDADDSEGSIEDDNGRDLFKTLQKDLKKLLQEEDDFQHAGSGWSIEAPESLTVRVSRFPLKPPFGKCHIELPKRLLDRQALLSVRNTDTKCFMYAILSKHIPNKCHNSILKETDFEQVADMYDFTGLKFPMTVRSIKRFENKNRHCSVNVYQCGPDCDIIPCRIAPMERRDHTDLLLYKDYDGQSHYVLILDFAKLMRPQVSPKTRHAITICKRCFTNRQTRQCRPSPEEWLKRHLHFCQLHKPSPIELPKPGVGDTLRFEEYETQVPVPVVCYADFEAFLMPTARTDNVYEEHVPNSFCTLTKSTLPTEILENIGIGTEPHIYRGNDTGKAFLLHMLDLGRRVEELYTRLIPLNALTTEQELRHSQATICDLCQSEFDEGSKKKCLDHCHITGDYRHSLCNSCNLRAKTINFLPIYLHGMSHYDQNFIVKELSVLKGCRVSVIPSNTQKFISFSIKIGKIWLRFLDSYRMMPESLATLASNLTHADLIESSKLVPHGHIDLITRKGVYPYNYVRSHSQFLETSLPPKEAFFNLLSNDEITDGDYHHAEKVWHTLNMRSFGEFHDFYLRLDVCLLADAMESFRSKCRESYNIDCCHHYTAPGLAFKAMLRMTQVTLSLFTDPAMFLFVESAVRGGLVQSCLRYAKANNTDLEREKDYRPDDPKVWLLYLDAQNLYGYAMEQPLPYGNFEWVEDVGSVDWIHTEKDSQTGYLLECDVEIANSVHDRLQELPPMPEVKIPPNGKTKKLLATLMNKTRYVAHYTVFQQALNLGLKVSKVHTILKFSQSTWMKRFINLNTTLRANSTTSFGKLFYKLMNNSVYGKTMENVRNRVNVKIVTTKSAYEKLARQATFKEHRIINDNLILVQMERNRIVMDKPIYVGVSILDQSKVHMYNFNYNVMHEHFKKPDWHLELAYLDTDGGIWYIRAEKDDLDLKNVLSNPIFSAHLDRSVYPEGHPLKCDENKGKIGLFKDECKGRSIYELVALRPKTYAYRFNSDEGNDSQRKAKGIKTGYVNKHLRFHHYKETLFNEMPVTRPEKAEFNLIRSKNFQLTSIKVTKKGLSAEDDKRQILACGIRTLPYGHYRLNTDTE